MNGLRKRMAAAATVFAFAAMLSICGSQAFALPFRYEWKRVAMSGERTGCKAPAKDNAEESLGKVGCCSYLSPSGKKFGRCSATAKTASVVIAAQGAMAHVKDVIGFSPEAMSVAYPESALSNLFIDRIMASVGELSGKRVDVGVGNFGGIRVDMPQGDILLDDMLSMFPFRNQVVYVEHKGSTIRAILEKMASTRFQVLGGLRVVASDGRIESVTVGGEPLDDDKVYGVATISFLLNGGDNLYMADGALEVEVFDVDIIDIMLDYVKARTAAGLPVTYQTDGRVIIR